MAIEYRDIRGSVPEASEDGKYSGRAVPFDSPTQIGPKSWGFEEKFNRNAFNKYLREGDTVWLDQHDSRLPVARTSAGTLTLTKRNGGLEWDAEPTSNASYVADVKENIRCGNYGGCSVGFEVVSDAWTDDDGKESDQWDGTKREVLEAKLPEFSTVTFPAYKDTNVQQNSAGILSERRAAYESAQRSLLEERQERADAPEEVLCARCQEPVEARSEETPAAEAEETGEPVTTTRENDESETAPSEDELRADEFRRNTYRLGRMSDLG